MRKSHLRTDQCGLKESSVARWQEIQDILVVYQQERVLDKNYPSEGRWNLSVNPDGRGHTWFWVGALAVPVVGYGIWNLFFAEEEQGKKE